MTTPAVLALDLEGTLISNAMSQFPRHGLHRFLSLCAEHIPRLVLYTAVRADLARQIVQRLAAEGSAPSWFGRIEIVEWEGPHKDLAYVQGHAPHQVLLVDDNQSYVLPSQHLQWVRIEEFASPYEEDAELERVWSELGRRIPSLPEWPQA